MTAVAALGPLRALVVDDSAVDAELIVHALQRHGYDISWTRLDRAEDLAAALVREPWDVVLSDYVMPGFGGLEALQIVAESGLDLPFILLSGTVGEEIAVEAMRAGAHDYLLKDNLTRLGPAVDRERREAAERRERRRAQEAERAAEARTRRLLAEAEASRRALLSAVEDLQITTAELRLQTSALEAAANTIVITDREGVILWANPAFTALTGYTLEETRGHNPRELVRSGLHSADLYGEMWATILAGRVWQGELVNRRKDDSLYTEEMTITPVRAADGAITRFVAVKQDISERKRVEAERLSLEMQLHQSQRIESVGRLAGGVAHDFNNALGIVLGHAELALKDVVPGSAQAGHLEAIRAAGQRSASLTRQLLGFARQQPIEPRLIDVNQSVAEMLRLLRQLIGENVRLVWRPGTAVRGIRADPSQVDQVVTNLIVNARDAIASTGEIVVETRNSVLDEAFTTAHPGSRVGEYVELAVTDDGCGMEPQLAGRIFEPFFTTKAAGKGTGLGLSTVYGIVKQNGGYVEVRSAPGRGSSFHIYLPAAVAGGAGEDPVVLTDPATTKGSETLLVVEDEPAMLEVTRDLLGDLGYQVFAVGSPGAALSLAEQRGGAIDLLITDVVMPEMNGRELAAALQARFPGLRCLFVSGYTADVIAQRGVVESGVRLLSKPFTAAELAAKVREALDAEAGS